MMALSGVRSSWLIIERKRLLARLADCAAFLASIRTTRLRNCSIARRRISAKARMVDSSSSVGARLVR